MDEDKSLKEMLLVPGIVAVVLIVAVIIMNVLVDKKVEDRKNNTTTTTQAKEDIYGPDIIIEEGVYNFDYKSDGGISFYFERNEEYATLYYLNEDTSYLPVNSKVELIKNDEGEYLEYYKFEMDDLIVELTANDSISLLYKDSDGKSDTVTSDQWTFSFEGIYKNDDYVIVLFASRYFDGSGDDSVKPYEFTSYIYDSQTTYVLDIMPIQTTNNYLPSNITTDDANFSGMINGINYNLNIRRVNDFYAVTFNSDLFNTVTSEDDYRKFNGTYKK